MPSTYLTINRQIIARNTKHGTNHPPIRIAKGKRGKPVYAKHVKVHGPSELVYDPARAIMGCGARLVLKTDAEVEITDW